MFINIIQINTGYATNYLQWFSAGITGYAGKGKGTVALSFSTLLYTVDYLIFKIMGMHSFYGFQKQ